MRKSLSVRILVMALCCVAVLGIAFGVQPSAPQMPAAEVTNAAAREQDATHAGEEASVASSSASAASVSAAEGDAARQRRDATSKNDVATVPADSDEEEGEDDSGQDDGDQDEDESGDVPRASAIPEEAAYESQAALVAVAEGATADEVVAELTSVDGVASVDTTDLATGFVRVSLTDDTSVENVVGDLSVASCVEEAQPDYRYVIADYQEVTTSAETTSAETSSADEGAASSDAASATASDESSEQLGTGTTVKDDASAEDEDGQSAHSAQKQNATDGDTSATTTGAGADAASPGDAAATEGASTEDAVSRSDEASASAVHEDAISASEESVEGGEAEASIEKSAEQADDDNTLAVAGTTNDPKRSQQWALGSVQAYDAWDLTKADGKVTVAIMDAGFDVGHVDLASNVVAPYNAYANSTNVSPSSGEYEHGTHVAGIVSAVSNNGTGVSGVSYNAHIMPVRVTNSEGTASTSSLVRAFTYVIKNASSYNVRVINLSMCMAGPVSTDPALIQMIDQAYAAGIVTVVASGNSSKSTPVPYASFPGDYEKAVSVIGLEQNGTGVRIDDASNYNVAGTYCKNISAPGWLIYSTVPDDSYETCSGTSMATPCVSAILALEFATNASLSAAQAVNILYGTALDLGSSGWDETYGWGEANAYFAVMGARDGLSAAQAVRVKEMAKRAKAAADQQAAKSIRYCVRTTKSGWASYKKRGATAGSKSSSSILQGIKLKLTNAPYTGGIAYKSRIQGSGWQGWRSNGSSSGTSGSKKIEAVRIKLTGTMAKHYDVYYRVYAQGFGWMGWAKNGAAAGTSGYSYKLRALQVRIVPKDSSAPGSTAYAYRFPVKYRTYVRSKGWQVWKKSGKTAGTTKKKLYLSAVSVKLAGAQYSGSVQCCVRLIGKGWQGWKKSGKTAGTTKKARYVEALRIRLKGAVSKHYDVYYRVYSKKFGWSGWAKNGAAAGSEKYKAKLQAVQVSLVEKGLSAPGPIANAYREK